MDNTYVNLTAPAGGYESQLADIVRRQKYAELLAKQGASEIDAGSVGGVPTPISPFQGLAKVFQQGMGGYLEGRATKDQAALEASDNAALLTALKNRSTTPDTDTEASTTTMPGTTRGNISTGPYGLTMPSIPVSGHQRSPSELASYDLTQAGSKAMSKPNRDMFLNKFAEDQTNIDSINKLKPQVEGLVASGTLSPETAQSLTDAFGANDVTRVNRIISDIDAKRIPDAPSPKDALLLKAATDYMAKHPGSDITDFNASAEGKVAKAQSVARLGEQENLAKFTKELGNQDRAWVTITDKSGKPVRAYLSKEEILAKQNAGVPVSDVTVKPKAHLTAQQFLRLSQDLTSDVNTATRLKAYMKEVGDTPQGFKLIATQFSNAVNTAFGNPISAQALKVAMQNGDLQSLIGQLRLETVGGGVMTEQDAIRVISALGGDLNLLRNKQVVEDRIKSILSSKEARIKQNMQFYNRDADANDVAPMEYNFGADKQKGSKSYASLWGGE
jgi:hypothetical protein